MRASDYLMSIARRLVEILSTPAFIAIVGGVVVIFIISFLRSVFSKRTESPKVEEREQIAIVSKKKDKKQRVFTNVKKTKKGEHPHPFYFCSIKDYSDSVPQIAFSPAGKYLYTIGEDRTVRAYLIENFTTPNHKYYRTNIVEGVPNCCAVSNDGKNLLVCAQNSPFVYAFNVSDKKGKDGKSIHEVKRFNFPKGHKNGDIASIDISKNSKFILTCSSEDTAINLWDLKGNLLQNLITNQIRNHYARISPDSSSIVVGTHTSEVKFWRIVEDKSGNFKEFGKLYQLNQNGHKRGVNWVSFSHDGKRIATASNDGTWKLWNLDVNLQIGEDPRCLFTFTKEGVKAYHRIEISPNSKVIAITSGTTLIIFDVNTLKVITEIEDAQEGNINALSWSSDSALLATSGVDGLIRIWKINN